MESTLKTSDGWLTNAVEAWRAINEWESNDTWDMARQAYYIEE